VTLPSFSGFFSVWATQALPVHYYGQPVHYALKRVGERVYAHNMNSNMNSRYRVFRRGWGTYYSEDLTTGKQESLRTRDKAEAFRLVAALNETDQQPAFSLHLARVYWKAGDPAAASRTWQRVMEEILKLKKGNTLERWNRAVQDTAFDSLRGLALLETQAHYFLAVLNTGSVSTNTHLRRIHNFAMDMSWLPWPILPKKRWPVIRFKPKRAITFAEHQAILAGEANSERRAFFELLWETGGSQSDIATLTTENFDRQNRVLSYARHKTGTKCQLHFCENLERLLDRLPQAGLLFPRLAKMHEKHRAQEFWQRCLVVGITGVTLHSYRYAWAERAKQCGYPERFAQEALGHNSKAVHRAYARMAQVTLPSLESFEKKAHRAKIIPFPKPGKRENQPATSAEP
jgi:integrase